MTIRTLIAGIALSCAALAGCSSDYSIDFGLESQPPVGVDVVVAESGIRLEDGIAVAVVARPFEDDDKMDWETELSLESTDIRVIEVSRRTFDEVREERRDDDVRDGDWRFLLEGRRAGRASVEIWLDGELEGEIPVTVTEQPDP